MLSLGCLWSMLLHKCWTSQLSVFAMQGAAEPLPGWGSLQEWGKPGTLAQVSSFLGRIPVCCCFFSMSMTVSWFHSALASIKAFSFQWGQGRSHIPLMKSYSMIFNSIQRALLTAHSKFLQIHFLGLYAVFVAVVLFCLQLELFSEPGYNQHS